MQPTRSINVILVDDHPIVREGLKHVLSRTGDIEVVGEAGTSAEALRLVQTQVFDIALIDIALPDQSGFALLRSIKQFRPQFRALMLSSYLENDYAVSALRDGACGYMMKTAANEELAAAIRVVAAGGKYLSPRMIDILGGDWSETSRHNEPMFSDRERQILRMLALGRGLTEIGNELHLSIKTISTYRSRILEKTGFTNNAEIVRYALERGLIS